VSIVVINEFRYHLQKFNYKSSQEDRGLNVVAESQKPLHHLLSLQSEGLQLQEANAS
jgi:hypothetical protein